MQEYHGVDIISLNEGDIRNHAPSPNTLVIVKGSAPKTCSLQLKDNSSILLYILVDESAEYVRAGSLAVIISLTKQKNLSYMIKFSNETDTINFYNLFVSIRTGRLVGSHGTSHFDQRTEESSSIQYFQFYGYLSQQQNMMQDYVRTSAYQNAILSNSIDFNGKVRRNLD